MPLRKLFPHGSGREQLFMLVLAGYLGYQIGTGDIVIAPKWDAIFNFILPALAFVAYNVYRVLPVGWRSPE